jgi:hypothetical protein
VFYSSVGVTVMVQIRYVFRKQEINTVWLFLLLNMSGREEKYIHTPKVQS